ncbi:hypothetical protein LTR84_007277 [Exophiala bonariae]|uniref:Zn(2)-C6 fungal-type domain-containing protein n=1 Tax=Exophiala bonariae TaxID=1690606 RepID=A0AAV9N1N4_9EURO|nr:hypothetical protein LTR84_007277 [Exophiala bonariae]
MSNARHPTASPSDTRTFNIRSSKRKVKTGCQTCKDRKVKCDEGRPTCTTCLSTRRVCQGYGIWGGGDNGTARTTTINALSSAKLARTLSDTIAPETRDEHGYLQWFRLRTAIKLRGSFEMKFWDALVLQASLQEPAIYHAMLALSSMQKRCCTGLGETSQDRDLALLDQFTLRHYNKAIKLLIQPRFASEDKESVRVVLIACMLFICIEFLRGNYITGNNHLQNGVRILELLPPDLQGRLDGRNSQSPNASSDSVDVWIIQVFSRMNLLARQFGKGLSTYSSPSQFHCRSLPITFESLDQARNCLDYLFHDILCLQKLSHQEGTLEGFSNLNSREELYSIQRQLQANLNIWSEAYKASRVRFEGQLSLVSQVGHRLLYLYHIMASISADTCLQPGDEMLFDSHSQAFASMIVHAIKVLKTVRRVHDVDTIFRHEAESSRFTPDIGWIPPLYYTVIHCRVHRLRMQAIRLLRALPSKEGIWDSRIASLVADEVVRVEEGDFYKDSAFDDAFDVESLPQDCDLNLRTLPASFRVRDVQIKFPDGISGTAVMTYIRSTADGSSETMTKAYELSLQSDGSRDRT